jgi:hypothetical protein
MANRARGETAIIVPGIGEVILCLTMAGMAALEDAFEVENLQQAVMKVGENPSSRNLALVLHALMMGTPAGDQYTVEDVRRWPVTPAAIREAMAAMNASSESAEGNAGEPGNRAERRAKPKG